MCLPSEHHDGGLRVSPWGASESGAIDHTQGSDAQHSVVAIHHLADDASAMVMPNGGQAILAPLLDVECVVRLIVQVARWPRAVDGKFHRSELRRHRVVRVHERLEAVCGGGL